MALTESQRLSVKDQLVAQLRAQPTVRVVEGREYISRMDPNTFVPYEFDRLEAIEEVERRFQEMIFG